MTEESSCLMCGNPVRARGHCKKHYDALRHKKILKSVRINGDDKARFLSRVEKQSGGCWTWKGNTAEKKARFYFDGANGYAQRFAYKMKFGYLPIAPIVRTCGHRSCVNPAHLRVNNAFFKVLNGDANIRLIA